MDMTYLRRGLDLFAFIPPCHATMRIDGLCQ